MTFTRTLIILALPVAVLFPGSIFAVDSSAVNAPQGSIVNPPQGSVVNPPQGSVVNPPQGSVVNPPRNAAEVSTKLQNPIKANSFYDLVAKVIQVLVSILMPFVVLGFIWSGFLYVYARGNENAIKRAHQALLYTVVGSFILLGAWGFAQVIGSTVATITGINP